MNRTVQKPHDSLNKAFLRIKPGRESIELFKKNLIHALDCVNEKETEEFHKNIMMEFFKKTYYDPDFYINTKGKNDWVIHNGGTAKNSVGVIIETKSPKNRAEMISVENINGKALQELVLYYLRERITHKNNDIRHLVVTNVYEWFIFDAQNFDKIFAQSTELVRKFKESEEGKSSNSSTDAFYKQTVKPFIDNVAATIEFTHFDIRRFDKPLRNNNKEDDKQLIVLYKLFSPEHLLKLSFVNDSNTLDKNFYAELLHIIGLTETKEGGKKIIGRHKPGFRNGGSLLENAIVQIDSLDKLQRVTNLKQYGDTTEERLFNVALELTITWVNRILFLKLLEAQLTSYHRGDKNYSFLNSGRIKDYDSLNVLFFQVLARKPNERNPDVQKLYANVPYLNSSLFEPTELEHETLFISQIEGYKTLTLLPQTILKSTAGKKRTGELDALEYFFAFLDAYDFASEGSEDIQEDNKTLINASVLGLIFEKINGYKDGSFFTPGFITMYMCRETIRRAVVQRFNEIKGWNVKEFNDLKKEIEDREEANYIVNSLRICDPAVGSGHFLVSALNEIIAIKHELHILVDKEGMRLSDYRVEVVNDELMVTNEMGRPFQYNPLSQESQRVQQTLFHEKETIIENCLFGVDINPNSVKICRLRLWIELLKNAYYKVPPPGVRDPGTELETLPNIDINIKCGNSLISRFPLDADLKKALKSSKWNIESYKNAVVTYRNADNKEHKRAMEKLINDIKGNFRSEINKNDPKVTRLYKLKGELYILTQQTGLFERSKKEQTEWNKKVKILTVDINRLEADIEEIISNKMYENAFEWRFEFPEVLDDEGDFVGFNAIIGNPPYIQLQKMGQAGIDFQKMGFDTYNKTGDIYSLFYELGFKVLKQNGVLSFITSNKWMRAAYGESLRNYFVEKCNPLILVDFGGVQVFDTATVDTNIFIGEKASYLGATNACVFDKTFSINNISDFIKQKSGPIAFNSGSWVVLSSMEQQIKNKIEKVGKPLKDWDIQINYGIKTGFNEAFIITTEKRNELIEKCPEADSIIRPLLNGNTIKKYAIDFKGTYIINSHNGSKAENLEPINLINDFPEIHHHILSILSQIDRGIIIRKRGHTDNNSNFYKRSDRGITPFNLRSCTYISKFSLPKIVWKQTSSERTFTFDDSGFFLDVTGQILTHTYNNPIELKYILAILNSTLISYFVKCIATSFGGQGVRWIPQFIEIIPIVLANNENQIKLAEIVDQIQAFKKKNKNTLFLENEIDRMIFELYNLSDKEIAFIDSMKSISDLFIP
jgi:adenine-specific DNA-methyltransferase